MNYQYPLYVNWIPSYHPLSERVLDIISDYLDEFKKGEQFDDLGDVVEKEYVTKSVKLSGMDLQVNVFKSGLLVVKGKPQTTGNLKDFSYKAKEVYQLIKEHEGVHVHIFDHQLSDHFPIEWCFPKNKKWVKLRPDIIEKLLIHFFNDLETEKQHSGDKKEDLITSVLTACRDILRPQGFFTYLYPRLPRLIERRLKAAIFLSSVLNCIGVQTFINSFKEITKSTEKIEKDINSEIERGKNFIKGYGTAAERIKEYTNILGSYSLQVVVVILTIFGVSIGIIIPFGSLALGIYLNNQILGLFSIGLIFLIISATT